MTFRDLPPRANEIPLTNRRVAADVMDLIIGDADRAVGCVGVMVCDDQDRGIQPILMQDVAPGVDVAVLVELLQLLLPMVARTGGSVLVGRGRPHGTAPDDVDRAWHQTVIDRCTAHGVALVGFYPATADGIMRLPEPLSAAS